MIVRGLAIVTAFGGLAALWFGYNNLNVFRGTPLFEFRYFILAIAAFLGLSALEWLVGWIKSKIEKPDH
jgi:hypothetical protein